MLKRLSVVALLALGAALGPASVYAQTQFPEQPPCRANETGYDCFDRLLADQGHDVHAKFLASRQGWCRFFGSLDYREYKEEISAMCRPVGIHIESGKLTLQLPAHNAPEVPGDERDIAEFVERGRRAHAADMDLMGALGCPVRWTMMDMIQPIMRAGAPICWDLNRQIESYGTIVRFHQGADRQTPPCHANETGLQCFTRIIADKSHQYRAKFLLSRQRWCRFYALIGSTQKETLEKIDNLCRDVGIYIDSDDLKLPPQASDDEGLAELGERGRLAADTSVDLLNSLECSVRWTGWDMIPPLAYERLFWTGMDVIPPVSNEGGICYHLNYQVESYRGYTQLADYRLPKLVRYKFVTYRRKSE
jgi:hypothetical protein